MRVPSPNWNTLSLRHHSTCLNWNALIFLRHQRRRLNWSTFFDCAATVHCLNRSTLFLCVTTAFASTEDHCFITSPPVNSVNRYTFSLHQHNKRSELKYFIVLHHHITLPEFERTDLLRHHSTLPGLKHYSQIIFSWLNLGSQVLLLFYYQDDQIDDNELAGACSTHFRMAEKRNAHNSMVTKRKDRDHVRNTGLDGTVMFKWILCNLSWGYELDSSGLWSRLVAGSWEHENELRDLKKRRQVSWQLAQILSFWLQSVPSEDRWDLLLSLVLNAFFFLKRFHYF